MSAEELARMIHEEWAAHVRKKEGVMMPPWSELSDRSRTTYLAVAAGLIERLCERFPALRVFVK